jgi:hypothetical protein
MGLKRVKYADFAINILNNPPYNAQPIDDVILPLCYIRVKPRVEDFLVNRQQLKHETVHLFAIVIFNTSNILDVPGINKNNSMA